jgi:hypothetical protein
MSMSNSFVGQISIPPNLLAIDGITRSGKFWLAELITYFEGMEPVLHEPVLDFISIKAHYGELDKTSAVDLFRNIVSHKCFITSIGRNLNTRLDDSSSIYRHPRLAVFLNRSHQMRDTEFEKLKTVNFDVVCYPILAHDCLSVWGVQADAFPAMKLIRVERNPIDLAYAWYDTGIGLKDMAFSHRFTWDDQSIPWFAMDFARDFESQSEVDRIINSIAYLFDTAIPETNALLNSSGGNLLVTTYERLGEDMRAEVDRISSHIGLRPIPEMGGFLATQEKKGRSKLVVDDARTRKLESLKTMASRDGVKKLLALAERYEIFAREIGH